MQEVSQVYNKTKRSDTCWEVSERRSCVSLPKAILSEMKKPTLILKPNSYASS